MICTGCGSKIPDGSKFCPYCGFNGANAANTPAMKEKPKTERKPSRKSKEPPIRVIDPERKPEEDTRNWWIWAIITVVCAGILAFVLIMGSNYIDYRNLPNRKVQTNGETASKNNPADEEQSSVTIHLPAAIMNSENTSSFQPETYAQEHGFLSAEKNADGSVTVTMSRTMHRELLDAAEKDLRTLINDLVRGEDTPYILQIDYNDAFTHIEIHVQKEAYEDASDKTPEKLSIPVAMYQALLETEYGTEIEIIDTDTDRIIRTVLYPQE